MEGNKKPSSVIWDEDVELLLAAHVPKRKDGGRNKFINGLVRRELGNRPIVPAQEPAKAPENGQEGAKQAEKASKARPGRGQ